MIFTPHFKTFTQRINNEDLLYSFMDRGSSKTLICIPGWAFDGRVFLDVQTEKNMLILDRVPVQGFEGSLLKALHHFKINQSELLGFSLGGFFGSQFEKRYPETIEKLWLVGVRQQYTKKEILFLKNFIQKDKKRALKWFYSQCFSTQTEWERFKQIFFEEYLDCFSSSYLEATLESLSRLSLTVSLLSDLNLTFIHGTLDKIAPIEEVSALSLSLPGAECVKVSGAGHVEPLFRKSFFF